MEITLMFTKTNKLNLIRKVQYFFLLSFLILPATVDSIRITFLGTDKTIVYRDMGTNQAKDIDHISSMLSNVTHPKRKTKKDKL